MFGGAGAAIGNQEEVVGQIQGVPQQMILLFDAGVAIAVAIVDMTRDGHGAEIIDNGGEPELQHLVFALIASRDVGGRVP